jgi:hypothetical protein
VPIVPEDIPLLEKLERRLPNNSAIRLDTLIARLSFHAPEVFVHAPRPLLDFWLMEAVLRYQGRKYPDPASQ